MTANWLVNMIEIIYWIIQLCIQRPNNMDRPIESSCKNLNDLFVLYNIYKSFKATTTTLSSHFETVLTSTTTTPSSHFQIVPTSPTTTPSSHFQIVPTSPTTTPSSPTTTVSLVTVNINVLLSDKDKNVQISISTSGSYVEIAVGTVFGLLGFLVISFYVYKKCFRPDLTTPRPIKLLRRNFTERLGLGSLFTPDRPANADNLNDAVLLNESYTGSDISPA